jgi:toxin ParE1/3/4
MSHEVILHAKAEEELVQLYDYIADRAGAQVAWNYVSGLRRFVTDLADFPRRGSLRESKISGLRVIGYRRSTSVAFVVGEHRVLILGFFYNGRLLSDDVLQERR